MDETILMELDKLTSGPTDYLLYSQTRTDPVDPAAFRELCVRLFKARTGYEPERVERWQQRADILFLGPVVK